MREQISRDSERERENERDIKDNKLRIFSQKTEFQN